MRRHLRRHEPAAAIDRLTSEFSKADEIRVADCFPSRVFSKPTPTSNSLSYRVSPEPIRYSHPPPVPVSFLADPRNYPLSMLYPVAVSIRQYPMPNKIWLQCPRGIWEDFLWAFSL